MHNYDKLEKMTFTQGLIVYICTFLVFFAIDLIWLGFITRGFYRQQLSNLMAEKVKWIPALVFYFIYIIGVLLLVVMPASDKASLSYAVLMGALLGFVSYSTYDLSNMATLKNWSKKVVFADITWGTILTAIVSLISYSIAQSLA